MKIDRRRWRSTGFEQSQKRSYLTFVKRCCYFLASIVLCFLLTIVPFLTTTAQVTTPTANSTPATTFINKDQNTSVELGGEKLLL